MELAEVHELVIAIAGVDAACRDRSVLVAAVAASARLRAWLDGRDVALAAQMEQVASYPEKALADASRTSLRDAERTVRRAHTVQSLPPLGEALAVGAVAGAHVDIAARALRQLEPHERGELVDRATWLAAMAGRTTPEEFGRTMDAEVRRIRRDGGAERLEQQRRATRLRTSVSPRDGMWCLTGRFDPATGLRLHGRLQAALAEVLAGELPESCPSDPFEQQDFLLAHALVALVCQAGAGAGVARPEVSVVVDLTETQRARTPIVDWGLPVEVPLAVLRELAEDADVAGVFVDHGVVWHAPGVLDLGRTCRVANRAQRRALHGLYATCAIPGCAVKYDRCKLHHVVWWEHGGATDLANLLPVCERHHHCIHDSRLDHRARPPARADRHDAGRGDHVDGPTTAQRRLSARGRPASDSDDTSTQCRASQPRPLATGQCALVDVLKLWYHDVMPKNLTVRLDDDLAADTAALARAEGQSVNETVKTALREAVERRRKDPAFRKRVRQIIEEDRELLERLAK